MHPKHSILLKKNARRLTQTSVPVAFYFVEDKQDEQTILHIDKKITSSARFSNVKKVNRTLEAFDDEEYQVTPKARMCAGTVTRGQQGLVFSVEINRKLSNTQFARSLKKPQFKKLIGKAFLASGEQEVDVDGFSEETVEAALPRLESPLRAYVTSRDETARLLRLWTADGQAEGDLYDSLLERLESEGALVDEAVESIDNYLAAATSAGTAEATSLRTKVLGQALSAWSSELDSWEQALVAQLMLAEQDDSDLLDDIRDELREANLTDAQITDVEHAEATLSTWLLQQQEIFRNPDSQIDGLINQNEIYFTQGEDKRRVPIDDAKLAELGLEGAFALDAGGMLVVSPAILNEDGISPEGRKAIAKALINGVKANYDLHLRNPNSTRTSSDLDLRLEDADHLDGADGGIAQHSHRRRKASATNLQFDRQDEIVPGSEEGKSFRELLAEMNAAETEEQFAACNEMLHDAYLLDVHDGRVEESMTFLQYKLQFVDLEVPNILDSGLHWHDGSGQLNVAEWSFTHLRVKDLPEKTQYNYKIEVATPLLANAEKRFDKVMDLGIKPPQVPTEDDIYRALARDKFWAEYARGEDLISYYKGRAQITVRLGYADPDNGWELTWNPTTEPYFTGKVTGQDEILPLVNEIPENALKTLTTDIDGTTRNPRTGAEIDLTGDIATVQEQTATAIQRSVMKSAFTSWAGNSGAALSNLLQPIPDSQKVFLRQSNGTVNAIRIGNGDLRNSLKALAKHPLLGESVAYLEELLTQLPLNEQAITRYCGEISDYLDSWIAWSRMNVDASDPAYDTNEALYDQLKDAADAISTIKLTDIGQTAVITGGNDTGAFGKCAPTAYFCGAICGISVRAHEGLEALGAGSEGMQAEATALRELITGQPMDANRLEQLDAQFDVMSAMIQAEWTQRRTDINLNVARSPEYLEITQATKAKVDQIISQYYASVRPNMRESRKEALRNQALKKIKKEQDAQRRRLEALYKAANRASDDLYLKQEKSLGQVKQLKKSTLDQLVVTEDDNGPYFDMSFPVPREAMSKNSRGRDGWLLDKYGDPLPNLVKDYPDKFYTDAETGQVMMKVKVRPEDIQEYLEETNREDKYRGNKKHMMDFFKDPSSMNNIQLMENLGPGLIAVGLDKGLKDMGKDSGLLYGPGAKTVATMVYGKEKTTRYEEIKEEMPEKGTEQYKEAFKARRKQLLMRLGQARDEGGSIAVSMGFASANGHVNYIQSWGTPKIGGVEIDSNDVARCRMNVVENAAGSSAWNNDRVQQYPINPSAMTRGMASIERKLRDGGGDEEHIEAAMAVRGKAMAAEQMVNTIVRQKLGSWGEPLTTIISDLEPDSGTITHEKIHLARGQFNAKYEADVSQRTEGHVAAGLSQEDAKKKAEDEAWEALEYHEKILINGRVWQDVTKDSAYKAYLDALREASADAMSFLKDNMTLEQSADSLNEENVLIMPSNTERDNAVTDTEEDRERIGDGNIGSQQYGSANATDHSYFVPVNALASGWNGVVQGDWNDDNTTCTATRYNYSDDLRDQFVMLASMTVMKDR